MQLQTVRRGAFVWKLRHAELDGDWLQHPERLLEEKQSFRKARSSAAQARVVRFRWSNRNLVLKEYSGRRWRVLARAVVRGPRALQTLDTALRLEALGIPAIRAVAAGHRRAQPWYSLLVTEEIYGAVPLYSCLKQSQRSLRPLVRSAARLFAKLHDASFIHRDAHEANFVVPHDRRPEIIMVDLDGVRQSGRVTLRQVAKDLTRFHVRLRERISKIARLRFLVDYARFRSPPVTSRELAKSFASLGIRLR
jgi:tRNA A-37 threonylcarbamoyl transferase component Bud32